MIYAYRITLGAKDVEPWGKRRAVHIRSTRDLYTYSKNPIIPGKSVCGVFWVFIDTDLQDILDWDPRSVQ